MENQELKEKCRRITEKMKAQLSGDHRCIAAYLLGSASHDTLWEWSDIQIAVILDDGYKGKMYYSLFEEGMYVALNIYTLTAFQEFIGSVRADDFMWKAFHKRTELFSKNPLLDELLTDAFYIGDVDRQKEMLLGFSGAVYYLNKAEKNLFVKGNTENTLYFIPFMLENIAWIEIFKNRQIPERELIPQGKRISPAVFEKILESPEPENIVKNCISYLEENTKLVYQPILAYLKEHGNLEGFRYETRPHGFGINYEWLVRCGIAERYGIPEKIPFLKRAQKLGYQWKEPE